MQPVGQGKLADFLLEFLELLGLLGWLRDILRGHKQTRAEKQAAEIETTHDGQLLWPQGRSDYF
jgi:hypothetical protein